MAGGPGFGSIHHMILTIKNNKALLRKKSMFKKNRSFYEIRQEYLKTTQGKLEFKKASKEEILALRNKLKRKRKQRIIINTLVFVFISIVVFGGSYHIFKNEERKAILYNQKQKEKAILLEKKKQKENDDLHLYLVKEGDYNYSREDWYNAIQSYREANKLSPNEFSTELRLAISYCQYCYDYSPACNVAEKYINNLIYVYPDSIQLYQLRANLYTHKGNNKLALKDIETIDQLKK